MKAAVKALSLKHKNATGLFPSGISIVQKNIE
jgi:hypothetical protein